MRNDILGKLQIPAIGLIVGGVLNAIVGVLVTFSGILRFAKGIESETVGMNDNQMFGFWLATFVVYGVGLLSILAAPVIFYGALKMMGGKKLKIVRTAAILGVLPLTCCFPLSMIFGIWTLILLSKPEVKAVFLSEAQEMNLPPQPPQGW